MDRPFAAWQSRILGSLAGGQARCQPAFGVLQCARHSRIDMPANERASILAELTPPLSLLRPEVQLTPAVFCSPHSGRIYPKAFLEASRLDAHTLRKSEDCYVDELFAPVVGLGAPLIAARFPHDRDAKLPKHAAKGAHQHSRRRLTAGGHARACAVRL